METYQPIYDAVRSRIQNGDVGEAISQAFRDAQLSHYFSMAMESVKESAYVHALPSAVFKPKLTVDGNQWCALYGENLQEGVAGFGDSPSAAMQAFDNAWQEKLKPLPAPHPIHRISETNQPTEKKP